MTIIRTIPEPGQLVRLRQRQYVVTDVRQSIAPTRISSAGLQKSQHVVLLASMFPVRILESSGVDYQAAEEGLLKQMSQWADKAASQIYSKAKELLA